MRSRSTSQAGFTLVELMVVVVIATILLSIAIPSYQSSIRESRRTEAKTAIMDLAGREERYLSTNGANYSSATADMGYSGAGFPVNTPSGYYQLTVCVSAAGVAPACDPNASPPTGPAYYITASPLGSQTSDAQCGTFGLDSTGQQFVTGTLTTQQCWGQ